MSTVKLTINGQTVEAPSGATILEAARLAEIYIPTLCHHPDLPPAKGASPANIIYQGERRIENAFPEKTGEGCGLCVVDVEGEADLIGSCATEIREGMVVTTENDVIKSVRQEKLVKILARHPHACLTCAQQEGCPRTQCSSNVPENERCCPNLGNCELQDVANYVGISDATPKWLPTDLPKLKDDPLFERDYNLCIGCTRCVRACRDLRGVEAIGFVYNENGDALVGSLAPSLGESGCRFCTACVEVCPTGALRDKNVRPGKKEQDIVPCREACPAHVDVPAYLRLIANGKRKEADAVIREKVPFPGVLGRVCIHPCEDKCRRGDVNEPVSICALKRYAADGGEGVGKIAVAPDTGKKIAVFGSGPAGMTAAFYLRKKGHAVTVFESRDRAGGMMRYGVPSYRLPNGVLDKEIRDILDIGVELKTNKALGKDITFDDLKNDGYDAVFLAVGAQLSRKIPLEGAESPDVVWGVDFLGKVAAGEDIRLKEKVVVVGGGNVAVDVAMTARRCGAKDVTMICLECYEEMPASPWELEEAKAEGVKIMPSWGPHRIDADSSGIRGVELVECTCVFDDKGNFCPEFSDEKNYVDSDQVILAIGQASDLSFLEAEKDIATQRGLIIVNQETLETGKPGVYAGGDVVSVPGAIIHAVAAGRKAASSIDKSLGGDGSIDEVLFERETPNPLIGRVEGFADIPRTRTPERDPETRTESFAEIFVGFDDDLAQKEADRCLQCDLRLYMRCNPEPPSHILPFTEETILTVPDTEGVYQLFDEDKNVLAIKGVANLRDALRDDLDENENAAWFEFEEDKMYSKRESELISRYLQEHGEMPGGGASDLDDLF